MSPQKIFSDFLIASESAPLRSPTNVNASHYYLAIESIVDVFFQHQDATGAIIDPFLLREVQYATPCYAYCASLVADHENNLNLKKSALLAFEKSTKDFMNREAADSHEDFYSSPLAHAFRFLKKDTDNQIIQNWRSQFDSVQPEKIYRHALGGSAGPGSNWNCKALSGEYLLSALGLKSPNAYSQRSLELQMRFFDQQFGMYTEGPLVYDIFPRAWLFDMLQNGFNSSSSAALESYLDIGAITSLFLQQASGALPVGGRSSMHLWGDALQILIFEIAATRWKKKNALLISGVFKRAARKTFLHIDRWKMNSGEYRVVRNNIDPSEQYGYYGYTSHSHYNLLLATIIGYAWEYAQETEEIEEHPTPSELGSYVLNPPRPFNIVSAGFEGTTVQIALDGYPDQTPRGLVSIQFDQSPSQIPFADGLVKKPAFRLPGLRYGDLACGLEWISNERRCNFFDSSDKTISAHVSDTIKSPLSNEFTVYYECENTSPLKLEEHYRISKDKVQIKYTVKGNADGIEFVCPIFHHDGINDAQLELFENSLLINFQNTAIKCTLDRVKNISLSEESYSHRSGKIKILRASLEIPELNVEFHRLATV